MENALKRNEIGGHLLSPLSFFINQNKFVTREQLRRSVFWNQRPRHSWKQLKGREIDDKSAWVINIGGRRGHVPPNHSNLEIRMFDTFQFSK